MDPKPEASDGGASTLASDKVVTQDTILSKIDEIAKATGLSTWAVSAIKKATRDSEDSPFSGRYTTKRRIHNWLFTHKDFVASRVHRAEEPDSHSSPPSGTPIDPQRESADKSGSRSRFRGQRISAQGAEEHPRELSA